MPEHQTHIVIHKQTSKSMNQIEYMNLHSWTSTADSYPNIKYAGFVYVFSILNVPSCNTRTWLTYQNFKANHGRKKNRRCHSAVGSGVFNGVQLADPFPVFPIFRSLLTKSVSSIKHEMVWIFFTIIAKTTLSLKSFIDHDKVSLWPQVSMRNHKKMWFFL